MFGSDCFNWLLQTFNKRGYFLSGRICFFIYIYFSSLGYIFAQLKHCVQWNTTNTVKIHNSLNYWYGETMNRLNIILAKGFQLLTISPPVKQLPIFVDRVYGCWSFYYCFFFFYLSVNLSTNIPSTTVFSITIPSFTFSWLIHSKFDLQYVNHKNGLHNYYNATENCIMRWKLRWNEKPPTFLQKVRLTKLLASCFKPGFAYYFRLFYISFLS